ncbi:hypothetical protein [Bradyrhizobium sp. Arg816]|uniref:hypothetical protein n=1 Tax=Bradyrhizobium sp. Arg816 TaxID=2998491 RepID=UPI00249E661D|nr:hypothetical protein [Bradyrhizobium sp. Arg816]MDI3565091.1 hypothetical protein [Bradyrhizobium sp. Arg816]
MSHLPKLGVQMIMRRIEKGERKGHAKVWCYPGMEKVVQQMRKKVDGVTTSIPRVCRGNAEQLATEFDAARNAPDAIRRVFIVTSSLSRKAVEDVFANIATGHAPDPYFVQLYWPLLSFFSACTEMNAVGYVVCQE